MAKARSSGKNQLDTFARIAERGHEKPCETLVEPVPPTLPDIVLPSAGLDRGAVFSPIQKIDTPEKLHEELVRARRSAARFLRVLAPPGASTRLSKTLPSAEWRLEGVRKWKRVSLPHYGGPIGRATAWYRMEFNLTPAMLKAGSVYVCFGGVDYIGHVFVNGEYAGSHEGFFSPFEFDITARVCHGKNELRVRVENDAICHGNNSWDDPHDGDKLYAATGLGWDEPGVGWHHCPPGMGIHRPVRIEARPATHIRDLFVRPEPGLDSAELLVEVVNASADPRKVGFVVDVFGQNFPAHPVKSLAAKDLPPAGPGVNFFRIRLPLPKARLWSPDTPWLYQAQVTLHDAGRTDFQSCQFGMRAFQIDETSEPKGRLYLNGKPLRLRGANTMGHEQRCVFQGDLDQLRDDILLAKIANMNFLRLTQRPVEPEVYDLCDRLGLMTQTDLPLFGYLRRNQFCEAVRQAAEMERLVRGHACNVLNSFINEPFPRSWGDKSHRHLMRRELESFFDAATRAIHIENPDRQIKPIDGDYEPPGPGLPDNHCYAGWYNGHGLDLGKLHKGFWIPVKPGWNYACGEFGAEGLDEAALMRERYPAAWLPDSRSDVKNWTPARIHKAQTGGMYHLWMERQKTMEDWVASSQAHQAWIVRLMTGAFRRDNRMVSFAIHLFIDAWPAGWMKTIMDCRRHPKPAYFAFRDALTPLMANLRMDRTACFGGESLPAELWVCNDTPEQPRDLELRYQIECEGKVIMAARTPAHIRPSEAVFQGMIRPVMPFVSQRSTATLRLALATSSGRVLHDTSETITLFPPPARAKTPGARVIGAPTGKAAGLFREAGLEPDGNLILIDDPSRFQRASARIHKAVERGATAVLIEMPEGLLHVAGSTLRFENTGMEPRHFVAREPAHPLMANFEPNDFRFWFDPSLDRPAAVLRTLFFADEGWKPILRTGQGGWGCEWKPALAVAEKPFGHGKFVVSQITLAGRLVNPVARLFAERLLARQL
jgi:hypothetical protein